MNPFHRLTDDNKEQIVKYLKFFRAKKDSVLRSLDNEFEDSKMNMSDEMFSREDMEEFCDFLKSQSRSQIGHDLTNLINMSALAINEVLEAAQEQGAVITLDTASLENQGLCDSIEKMSMDSLPQVKVRGLVSLKDEAKAMNDESKAMKEASRLEESNKLLQKRFTSVQGDATKLVREKNELQRQVDDLERRLETAERSAQKYEMSGKGGNDNMQVQRLEDELEEARRTIDKRVSDTPQFQQMRKMMQSQNEKMRALRQRLDKYEPDNSKEDDF